MSGSVVHLVLPAYNEARRLPEYLPQLSETLAKTSHSWRITVVDDGSRESESAQMLACVQRAGSRVGFHRLPVNQGKGAAIYSAWNLDGESEWLALLDADGSIPPYEVVRVLGILSPDGPDAFFCSRCKILGRIVQRSWIRHVGGRLFATFVSVVTGIPVYDSQCGFKVVRRKSYEAVKGRLHEKRFAFDVELLLALTEAGATVIEYPIDWFDVPGSKVNFVRDTAQMLASIMRLRIRGCRYPGNHRRRITVNSHGK
jgi:dolichyl-phosphate beta-glucosyltransferase